MMVCRLSYVVWMLEELIHKIPSSADVCIMYDIACTLVQHLKGKRAAVRKVSVCTTCIPCLWPQCLLPGMYRRFHYRLYDYIGT